ncbi:hypothetical protein DFQ29_002029 [Apophysomyces sp. BC1021]|nr:hypothetical protein DFQ29_002029 [Apophysomyces sp. BC1021]
MHMGLLLYAENCILRLKNVANIEILLLKTSSAYDSATNRETTFDHFKGMFGHLAVLKTVADEFPLADYAIFKQLNLHLFHSYGVWNFSPHISVMLN